MRGGVKRKVEMNEASLRCSDEDWRDLRSNGGEEESQEGTRRDKVGWQG